MSKISLILAHPDLGLRRQIAAGLRPSPHIELIAETHDLMTTYTAVEEQEPMAVLIAERLAMLPEFEVMRALFATLDVRWLVIKTRSVTGAALPASPWDKRSDLFAIDPEVPSEELIGTLRSLTRTARRRGILPEPPAAPSLPGGALSNRFILLGASTGGVDALLTVLSYFPADCPPTFIVQHTGGGFGESLTRLLDRQCAAQVRPARDGERVDHGQVVIAAGSRAHLHLAGGAPMKIALRAGEPISGHMPSVDALFTSALPGAPRAVAALLTGMGRDGAQGLKALRDAGARTFAQDEETCIVYGMPRAARDLGAVETSLPLPGIGPALLRACATPAPASHGRMTAR
ncbi:CheB methylesterase domain-containing protein [Salipiger mangrovisoli]|uniref:protein-glutamate methylesterase n=1 Tax=Salipiger mangrovisoli TaxID=2865933 RepID=A0ABR9X431_9RHOB|nr:CheB methylesterase domain-containing protein [Salipiger mangrovisoli]MBE9638266.1 chemotaxis protein CheB [Salipiger mangrovisoli]